MMDMTVKKVQIPGPIFGEYAISHVGESESEGSDVILLLHGYGESSEYFFEKLKSTLQLAYDSNNWGDPQVGRATSSIIVVPNGPFFVPIQTAKGHRKGYSWYFYDSKTDEYIVDMTAAVNYIDEILKLENLKEKSLKIIGYSQGGYLAPFIGLAQKQTREVIGMSCKFLVDEFESTPTFRMTAIHGSRDEVVEFKGAEESIDKLKSKDVHAELLKVADGGHRLESQHLKVLQRTL